MKQLTKAKKEFLDEIILDVDSSDAEGTVRIRYMSILSSTIMGLKESKYDISEYEAKYEDRLKANPIGKHLKDWGYK